jgi:hypothetical protein
MDINIKVTGELVEIGRLENEGGADGLVIRRSDGSHITIKGLSMDEVKQLAHLFLEQIDIILAERAK